MAGTVGDLLESEGIEVSDHDVVAPGPTTKLTRGPQIAVKFGREVTFTVDGKQQTIWTTATTVDQAVDALGIDTAGAELSTSRSAADRPRGPGRRHRHREDRHDQGRRQEASRHHHRADRRRGTDGGQDHRRRDDKLSIAKTAAARGRREVQLHPGRREAGDQEAEGRLRHGPQGIQQDSRHGRDQDRQGRRQRRPHPSPTGWSGTTARSSAGSRSTRSPRSPSPRSSWSAPRSRRAEARRESTGGGRCIGQRVGQARPVRVRRQLVDQHRQRLLRRAAVHAEHLARVRRVRHAAPHQPRPADRRRQEGPGRRRAGAVAGLHQQAGPSLSPARTPARPLGPRAGRAPRAAAQQAARAELRHRRQHRAAHRRRLGGRTPTTSCWRSVPASDR